MGRKGYPPITPYDPYPLCREYHYGERMCTITTSTITTTIRVTHYGPIMGPKGGDPGVYPADGILRSGVWRGLGTRYGGPHRGYGTPPIP
jgi:hypothetical protein